MQKPLSFLVILVILARGARRPIFGKELMNPCKFFIFGMRPARSNPQSQNVNPHRIHCDSGDSGARRVPSNFRKKKAYASLQILLFRLAARTGEYLCRKIQKNSMIPCDSGDSGARRAPADFRGRPINACAFLIFGMRPARGNLSVAKCKNPYNSL